MTAKFEAFKAALHALCVEHGVRLTAVGYEGADLCAEEPTEGEPGGISGELCDYLTGTPEEEAAKAAEQARLDREREAAFARRQEEEMVRRAADQEAMHKRMLEIGWYAAAHEAAQTIAQEYRKTQMRISNDPADPHFVGTEPREVKVNDRAEPDWAIADEFRRVVIRKDGTVVHGSVYIERLPSDKQEAQAPEPVAPVADAGFVGMFVPAPKEEPKPAPAPVAAPAPVHKKHGKRK